MQQRRIIYSLSLIAFSLIILNWFFDENTKRKAADADLGKSIKINGLIRRHTECIRTGTCSWSRECEEVSIGKSYDDLLKMNCRGYWVPIMNNVMRKCDCTCVFGDDRTIEILQEIHSSRCFKPFDFCCDEVILTKSHILPDIFYSSIINGIYLTSVLGSLTNQFLGCIDTYTDAYNWKAKVGDMNYCNDILTEFYGDDYMDDLISRIAVLEPAYVY